MTGLERLTKIASLFGELKSKCRPFSSSYYGETYYVYNRNDIGKAIELLGNSKDAVVLSQLANNNPFTDELVKKIDLTLKEKAKYVALKKNNLELNCTLNFELLDDKYDFLWDEMQLISIDPVVQAQIVSLEDDRLEWFKQLFLKAQTISSYPAKYIASVLSSIGECPFMKSYIFDNHFYTKNKRNKKLCSMLDDLASKGYAFTNEQLNSLVFLLGTNAGAELSQYIENENDLNNLYDKNNPIQKHLSSIIAQEKAKPEKEQDKKRLKEVIFLKYFGLKYGYEMDCDVPFLLDRFKIEGLKYTRENQYLLDTYIHIEGVEAIDETDVLLEMCEFLDKSNFTPSYFEMSTFEGQMREEFAKQINEQLFSIEGKKKKRIGNATVYDAGTDFMMLVTALGSYQNLTYSSNYKDFWNSLQIRSHGNCCSLITNSNLATARQTSVVLGFRDMPKEALLSGNIRDANSTPRNRNYDINFHNRNQVFYSPKEHVNHTRDYYNELNYERIDISQSGKYFKKNPDYIVFFV